MTKTIKKGFTIIELLIVIVVIGILAAIVVVTYQGVQNKANKTAAEQNAREVSNKATAFNASAARFPKTLGELKNANDGSKEYPEAKLSEKVAAVVTHEAPTADHKTRIQYRPCIKNGDAVGARVYFWNYETGAVSTDDEAIKAGETKIDPAASGPTALACNALSNGN